VGLGTAVGRWQHSNANVAIVERRNEEETWTREIWGRAVMGVYQAIGTPVGGADLRLKVVRAWLNPGASAFFVRARVALLFTNAKSAAESCVTVSSSKRTRRQIGDRIKGQRSSHMLAQYKTLDWPLGNASWLIRVLAASKTAMP